MNLGYEKRKDCFELCLATVLAVLGSLDHYMAIIALSGSDGIHVVATIRMMRNFL